MLLKFPLLQLYICKLASSYVAARRGAPFGLLALRSSSSPLVRSFLATCGRWLRLFALVGLSPPAAPSRVGVVVLWVGCALLLLVSVLGMRRAPRSFMIPTILFAPRFARRGYDNSLQS